MSERAPLVHPPLRLLARLLFKVYNDIRVEGAEHIPPAGPVIIACNHPTYLDPAFLMVGLPRPIRFMAWEKPFRIPFLGALLRTYGSIPVDIKKPGKSAFEAAVKVLRGGEVFGIFPEGGRTRAGFIMNPAKSGVARLAMITGAAIVPATITGGSQVWPKTQFLPRPGPIRVSFHPPLRVRTEDRYLWRRDKTLERRLIDQVLDAIHQTLLPSLRREERVERLLRAEPAPPSPWVEGIPFLTLLAATWLVPAPAWKTYVAPAIPCLAVYLGLIYLEQVSGARGRGVKAARNLGPWLVLLAAAFAAMRSLPLWELGLAGTLLASMVWLQLFRFSVYRRLRAAALVAAYAGWLWRIRGLHA